jgi:hypothetical protein
LIRLKQYTTFQTPPMISSTSSGRERYRELNGLLVTQMKTNAQAGMFCAVIGLIEYRDNDTPKNNSDGSNFTLGDNEAVVLKDALEYTLNVLLPTKCETDNSMSKLLNNDLICRGFDKITTSTYDKLCDIMIETLSIN